LKLIVSEGIPFGLKDMSFYVHPKGNKHIKYNRRTQREARNVDEIFSDGEG
jgi:hypothetical protein